MLLNHTWTRACHLQEEAHPHTEGLVSSQECSEWYEQGRTGDRAEERRRGGEEERRREVMKIG